MHRPPPCPLPPTRPRAQVLRRCSALRRAAALEVPELSLMPLCCNRSHFPLLSGAQRPYLKQKMRIPTFIYIYLPRSRPPGGSAWHCRPRRHNLRFARIINVRIENNVLSFTTAVNSTFRLAYIADVLLSVGQRREKSYEPCGKKVTVGAGATLSLNTSQPAAGGVAEFSAFL